MKTSSKEKIEKARRLFNLIHKRRKIEIEEAELKSYFKAEITYGCLEAGDIVILIEKKSRTSLDQKALAADLGEDLKKYERVTEFEQVTVEAKQEGGRVKTLILILFLTSEIAGAHSAMFPHQHPHPIFDLLDDFLLTGVWFSIWGGIAWGGFKLYRRIFGRSGS